MERKRAKKKISDDLMTTCRGSSDQIPLPLDLIREILKWLPVKTLVRFLCVSKQFASIIRNRDIMKSYLIKSYPRQKSLFFTFEGWFTGKRFFFSWPQSQDQGESSSAYGTTYHMNCHHLTYTTIAPSVHGLICYGTPSKPMVYNPSTRRSITLPKIDSQSITTYQYLGYEPINGDYKVLCMMKGMHVDRDRFLTQELRVLTLGNGNSWRLIEDFPPHCLGSPDSPDICINGVLYYVAFVHTCMSHAVMCFDVRSEKIDLIEGPDCNTRPKLTSYEGKPAVLFAGFHCCSVNLWVLEDAAKHEWSKKYYVVPRIDGSTYFFHHVFCANEAGEIDLAPENVCSRPFYVFFYHPKKNIVRRVYIEGISELMHPHWSLDSDHNIISVVSTQVDNLMFV